MTLTLDRNLFSHFAGKTSDIYYWVVQVSGPINNQKLASNVKEDVID